MITIVKRENYKINADSYELLVELRGLSTDTKPTAIDGIDICNGSSFVEIDTQDIYFYDSVSETWKGGTE